MPQDKLISPTKDVQKENLADNYEDEFVKVYVYDKVESADDEIRTGDQSISKINIQADGISPRTLQTKLHKIKNAKLANGEIHERYFNALLEVSVSGEVSQVNRNKLLSGRFMNVESISLATNDFENISGDSAKFFTIGNPFNQEAYDKGYQMVYSGKIDPEFQFNNTELKGIKEVEDFLVDADLSMTTIDLVNTITMDSSTGKFQFIKLGDSIYDPKVALSESKYTFVPLINDQATFEWNHEVDFPLQDGSGTQLTQVPVVEVNLKSKTLVMKNKDVNKNFNMLDKTNYYKTQDSDPQVLIDEFIASANMENVKQEILNILENNFIDYAAGTSIWPAIFNFLRLYTIAERAFSIMPLSISITNDGNDQTARINIYLTVINEKAGRKVEIKNPDGSIKNTYYTPNIFDVLEGIHPEFNTIKIPEDIKSGITLTHNREALISSITGKGIDNEGKPIDLDFHTNETLVPIMIKPVEVLDQTTMYIPWMDNKITMPINFFPAYDASGFEVNELLNEMIFVTRLFNNSLKDLPLSSDSKTQGQIDHRVRIFNDNGLSGAMLSGKTAQQVNDGLYKEYLSKNNYDEYSDEAIKIRSQITFLSQYIDSSYSIAGGNNEFGQIYLPWYAQIQSQTPIKISYLDSNDAEVTPSNAIKILVKPLSNPRFNIKSNYFNIDQTNWNITRSKIKDLSKRFTIDRTSYTLPKLPDRISTFEIPLIPGQIDPTKEQALSYVVYLPAKSRKAIDDLYFKKADQGRLVSGFVTKTFDLPISFPSAPSTEETIEAIKVYAKDKYGVNLNNSEILNTGVQGNTVEERTFSEHASKGGHPYPKWLYEAFGVVPGAPSDAENANGYKETYGDFLGASFAATTASSSFGIAGSAYINYGQIYLSSTEWMLSLIKDSNDKWPWNDYEKKNINNEEQLIELVKKRYPQYKDYKISIGAITETKVGINWDKNNNSNRWWDFEFRFTATRYNVKDVIINFNQNANSSNVYERKFMFNKNEWINYIKEKDTYDQELFETNEVAHKLYSNQNVRKITEITIRSIWADKIKLDFNGVEQENQSFNVDDETITKQTFYFD